MIIKKLPAEDKAWALDKNGFRRVSDDRPADITALPDDDANLYYKDEPYTPKKLHQRLIITYSPKYARYQKAIREKQVERAEKMLASGNTKKQRKNPNDPGRFIGSVAVTDDGEKAKVHHFLDESKIADEALYDGLYSWGFPVVAFDANKAMRQISNHDYQYVQEYRRMVTVYFMTADGLQNRFCESMLFGRCRYSRSQLGYKLECQSYGSTEPQNFIFAERPRVIVTESVAQFPEEQLYDQKDVKSRTLRYPLDGSENLDIVCAWLKDNNCKYEELQVQNEMIGGNKDE